MRFSLNANRKLIATILFSVFYVNGFSQWLYSYFSLASHTKFDYYNGVGTCHKKRTSPVPVQPNEVAIVKDMQTKNMRKQNKHAIGKYDLTLDPLFILGNGKKGNKQKENKLPGGPSQPEMSSFKPVGADNMVDLFSGDFSYNIPLLDVGGYPVNIFYNSGITMEEDPSWVGSGWNINPGTLTRNMRGLPDDFNGDEVKKEMAIMDDQTVGANLGASVEIVGKELKFGGKKFYVNPTIGGSIGAFVNSYNGVGVEFGFSPSVSLAKKTKSHKQEGGLDTFQNAATLGANFNFNSQKGSNIGVFASFNKGLKSSEKGLNSGSLSMDYNSREGLKSLQFRGEASIRTKDKVVQYDEIRSTSQAQYQSFPMGAKIDFATPSTNPTISLPMDNFSASLKLSIGLELFGSNGSVFLQGYYSKSSLQTNTMISKSFGYLNYQNGFSNPKALMDFNRIADQIYVQTNQVESFPVYTSDVFSIKGEGTGGSFRAYRGEVGYMKDQYMKTNTGNFDLNVSLGSTSAVKVGVDVNAVYAPVEVSAWKDGNMASGVLQFANNCNEKESFYFRNPAEKTIIDENFYNTMGADNLVRFQMSSGLLSTGNLLPRLEFFDTQLKLPLKDNLGNRIYSPFLTLDNTSRNVRDKRTQIITMLSAKDASIAGLNRTIDYYPINYFPKGDRDPLKISDDRFVNTNMAMDKKGHHISEMTVLGNDGRRYVYGLPVYNFSQSEVSFNVAAPNTSGVSADGLVGYSAIDASVANAQGKDHFYQKETLPAFAQGFMLTGLLSPDYIDLKGDGITDDDHGNAIKFNYSKVKYNGSDKINWRTPMTAAGNSYKGTYAEGLLTDNQDDRASYLYGAKEMYYLNSIESKTMIAIFILEEDKDAGTTITNSIIPLGEHDGVDQTKPSYRLKEIKLYSKPDYVRNPTTAKSIKTVHFAYSHQLCPGAITSSGAVGKLTLEKIWFSFNNNIKQVKNPYTFSYKNPTTAYKRNANDRWGNYKKEAYNLGGLPISQFPYVSQPGINAGAGYTEDEEIAPWSLNRIKLPSGGVINVTYEKDDYGYVQNKRAMAMFGITGFSFTQTLPTNAADQASLYNVPLKENVAGTIGYVYTNQDKPYIFIDAKIPITSKAQIKNYFLQDVDQLYMKLYVTVPTDQFGGGNEAIPVYVDIDDYGIVQPNGSSTQFWIKTRMNIEDNTSFVMDGVLAFAKERLSSKIYKGSNTRGQGTMTALIEAIGGIGQDIARTVGGFDATVRRENKFRNIDLAKCFVRLAVPNFKKKGGGYRVKSVIISDEWDVMTGQPKADYGQEYDYTDKVTFEGQELTISSGVASYEPGVGNEENPFRGVLKSKIDKKWVKDQFILQETPVGETFFPSASVGYSKVRVSSIKKGNAKNGTGYAETVFYTTKDFPTITAYTPFDDKSKSLVEPTPASIGNVSFYSLVVNSLSQGLVVSLNDMSGKVRRQATYAENDLVNPISYTENYYKMEVKSQTQMNLQNNVPVIQKADGQIKENSIVGKDIEMMADFRQHVSRTFSISSADFNFDLISWWLPLPLFNTLSPVFYSEKVYHAASVVKIVNTYGILDSVVSIDKGSRISTHNLLYDAETGDVLLNSTQNMFNDPVYSFNYPSHWKYKDMGLAYKNIGTVLKNVDIFNGIITSGVTNPEKYFFSGDEVMIVNSANADNPLMTEPGCSEVAGQFVYRPTDQTSNVIWVLDNKKDPNNASNPQQFVFLDRQGNPYTGKGLTLRIIRSGYRNLLGASVGSVVSKQNPIITTNVGGVDVKSIAFTDNTDVLNAGVQEFKEMWKTEPLYKQVKTITPIYTYPLINEVILRPSLCQTVNVKAPMNPYANNSSPYDIANCSVDFPTKCDPLGNGGAQFTNADPTGTLKKFKAEIVIEREKNEKRSFLGFDFSSLVGKQIIDAKLNLGSAGSLCAIADGLTNNEPCYPHSARSFVLSIAGQFDFGHAGLLMCQNVYSFNPAKKLISTGTGANFLIDATAMTQNIVNSNSSLQGFRMESVQNRFCDQILQPLKPALSEAATFRGDATTDIPTDITLAPGESFKQSRDGFTYLIVKYTTCPAGYTGVQENGVGKCVKYEETVSCVPVTDGVFVNPYVRGFLGDWKPYRSLVFYGDRRESNVTQDINIRKDGVIKNFKPYWLFNTNGLQPDATVKNWVWNSEITRYNHMGAELENKDALNRYNAGLFGYGDKLPIAVANNARYHEIFYDGFEDTHFQTQVDPSQCEKNKRLQIPSIDTYLNTTEHHTGKTSIKLDASQTITLNGNVRARDVSEAHSMNIVIGKTTKNPSFAGTGTGLTLTASNPGRVVSFPPYFPPLPVITRYNKYPYLKLTNQDDDPELANYYRIAYNGFIQAQFTGTYKIKIQHTPTARTGMQLWLNSQQIPCIEGDVNLTDGREGQTVFETQPIYFERGKLYQVGIVYENHIKPDQNGDFNPKKFESMQWAPVLANVPLYYTDVPMTQLYALSTSCANLPFVANQTATCTTPTSINPTGDYLNDGYAMLQGQKMVAGIWVKKGGQNCKCSTYTGIDVVVSFTGFSSATVHMIPKSAIIDGWQRFEGEFTVPATATTFNLSLNNTNPAGGDPLFFDDFRVHPFSSNMKSFVYNPLNLRLMAELDENNYASFYEYDDDGTLVRVKKETARGVMTITETRSSMQK
jgi:hypothetical protein